MAPDLGNTIAPDDVGEHRQAERPEGHEADDHQQDRQGRPCRTQGILIDHVPSSISYVSRTSILRNDLERWEEPWCEFKKNRTGRVRFSRMRCGRHADAATLPSPSRGERQARGHRRASAGARILCRRRDSAAALAARNPRLSTGGTHAKRQVRETGLQPPIPALSTLTIQKPWFSAVSVRRVQPFRVPRRGRIRPFCGSRRGCPCRWRCRWPASAGRRRRAWR